MKLRRLVAAACLLGALSGSRAGSDAVQATSSHPLPFSYDLYTFRGRGDSTAVIAAFAVTAGQLERETLEGGVRYRFDVTLVLTDTVRGSVTRTDDSVYVRVPRPLSGAHVLYTQIGVQAKSSPATQQRVIMTDATRPGIGQLYTAPFPVRHYGGDSLMLSDVALAQREPDAGWQRGDVRLALLPASQLPGSAFDVYYEIYNLPRGHDYTTEIAVEPAHDTRAGVRIRYSERSHHELDGTLPQLRHIDASVTHGRYRITVNVTDERTGAVTSSSRLFEVARNSSPATPVAALPHGQRRLTGPR
jgi:hypothetical protein